MTASSILDDATLSRFHVKTAAFGTAGQFCDGYILGIIAPALPVFARTHQVSPVMAGLLGASALVGLFLGSLVFGWLTDRIGRRRMFVFDLLAFVLLSLAQLAVTDALWLLILRFLLGVAVGADYSIAPTLVAEFAPRRYRAALLAAGPAMWTIGYVLAFSVGAAMAGTGTARGGGCSPPAPSRRPRCCSCASPPRSHLAGSSAMGAPTKRWPSCANT